jgi:hypothetical protein
MVPAPGRPKYNQNALMTEFPALEGNSERKCAEWIVTREDLSLMMFLLPSKPSGNVRMESGRLRKI